jgi:hypothetical protein
MLQKTKTVLISIGRWIVVSSENPENVSLTMQAGFVALLPTIMITLHLLKIPTPQEQIQQVVSIIEANAVLALQMVASGLALFGAGRKIYNSIYDLVINNGKIITPSV